MVYRSRMEVIVGNMKPHILCQGNYKDYDYIIISMNTHPCAYVIIDHNSDEIYGKDCDELTNIACHGGLTYSNNYLGVDPVVVPKEAENWIIGWDYCHDVDKFGDMAYGKEWTTKEIHDDVKNVIEQLIKMNKGDKQ